MWLGLSAVAAALIFALVKFFTSLHIRRLRERHMRLAHDIKRERDRERALDGKLQVETSRRGAVEKKLATSRRFKEDLYGRLRVELPESMQTEMRSCIDRHPVAEPSGVRVAHQLGLSERISHALDQLSILVIELPDTSTKVLEGLVNLLQEQEQRFSPPEEDSESRWLTTAFDRPDDALQFVRRALAVHDASELGAVRGILLAGLNVTDFDLDSVNKLFAKTLHGARAILESAPEQGLLIEGSAYELATDTRGFELYSQAEKLWHLSWDQLIIEEDETDKGPAGEMTTATESTAPAETDPPHPPADGEPGR